jgi:hypothetical protein
MKELWRTLDNRHYEDAVFETKTFLNQLEEVQTLYYENLCTNLQLTDEGEQYLFDYVYNSNTDSFEEYLEAIGIDYYSLVRA